MKSNINDHKIEVNNDDDDDDDPLEIKQLSKNFDLLINNINFKTKDLSNKVLNHIIEKKQLSDLNLNLINEKLFFFNNLLIDSNNINMEIDKLQQLQLFTKDFNNRLNDLSLTLKNIKSKNN